MREEGESQVWELPPPNCVLTWPQVSPQEPCLSIPCIRSHDFQALGFLQTSPHKSLTPPVGSLFLPAPSLSTFTHALCPCRYLIIENFIPPEEKNKIMNRLFLDCDEEQWKFQPLVAAGV